MLRVSATTTDTEIDLQGINGSADAASVGIEFGAELINFAASAATHDPDSLPRDRQALLEVAGSQVLVDAAGVIGNFQRMVRIADSIGIPVDNLDSQLGQDVRQDLDLARFPSAQNSLRP